MYGLGADALRADAVAAVFSLKGRPAANPLIAHVADAAMARSLAGEWPEAAAQLAEAFWPGPLTIVVPRGRGIPDAVTAGGPTVALRVPDHPVPLALLRAFGGPLVGPSANPSGRVSPTTAAHVSEAFPGLMVLEGGPCRTGIESTVIELSPSPRILRPGILTAETIGRVLGSSVEYAVAHGNKSEGAARSPGLLPHHYAPRAPAVLVSGERLGALLVSDQPVAVLSRQSIQVEPPHRLIRMPEAPAAYAAALYGALRAADAGAPALIAIEHPPEGGAEAGLWLAVRDRLLRATGARAANS